MKKEIIKTKNLREQLKSIMEKEISNFPELLSELEPLDRVNTICKIMPYIFPKVESVHANSGEGIDFGFGFD